jgi:hypothetical protein
MVNEAPPVVWVRISRVDLDGLVEVCNRAPLIVLGGEGAATLPVSVGKARVNTGGEDCRGSTDREISPGEETTIGRRGGGREAGVRGDGKGASTGKFGRTSPALVERPSRAWATPQGVRHKAEGHYVLLRPLAALAQDEEPERAGGKTGGPDVKSSAIRHRSNHSTCSASATQ